MPSSTYQTVGDILSAVFRDTKESSTTLNIQAQCLRWVNEGMEQIHLRKKRAWVDEILRVQTSSAAQRTFSITNGGLVATASSGTLPSASLDLYFKTSGFNEVYQVSSITGSVVTLANPYLGESNTATGAVVFQGSIVINSEVEKVLQVTHAFQAEPLQQLGPLEFFTLQSRDPARTDYATHFTVYDPTDSGVQRLWLYPAPQKAYTLNMHVQKYIPELTGISDEPRLPIQYRQALYHYVIYKMFLWHRNDPQAGAALSNFNTWLAKIDNDFKPTDDYPTLLVNYARPVRRVLYGGKVFDKRLRD